MNRKFEYKIYYEATPEIIELLSINVFPKIETVYEGLELKINQYESYRIIYIDKYNELIEEEIDSLSCLTPISAEKE